MTESANTVFERIGGQETVNRLVDAFYRNMDSYSEARKIRAMHADDLGPTRALLKTYLAEWLGGPRHYSAQKGPSAHAYASRASCESVLRNAMPGCPA